MTIKRRKDGSYTVRVSDAMYRRDGVWRASIAFREMEEVCRSECGVQLFDDGVDVTQISTPINAWLSTWQRATLMLHAPLLYTPQLNLMLFFPNPWLRLVMYYDRKGDLHYPLDYLTGKETRRIEQNDNTITVSDEDAHAALTEALVSILGFDKMHAMDVIPFAATWIASGPKRCARISTWNGPLQSAVLFELISDSDEVVTKLWVHDYVEY